VIFIGADVEREQVVVRLAKRLLPAVSLKLAFRTEHPMDEFGRHGDKCD
jgi:hypothetical protein